jgi:methylmalonyl-CoA/ethylmalonyl-CoA epimerase
MMIDHIGVVVPRLEEGIKQWTILFGYSQMTEDVCNVRQKVRVVFMAKEGSCLIKLIEPMDESSVVYRFAQRGGGLHHICFRCDGLDAELGRLRTLGIRVLEEPQPGEAFYNERIAFVFTPPGLIVELIDTEKKAKLIDTERKVGHEGKRG